MKEKGKRSIESSSSIKLIIDHITTLGELVERLKRYPKYAKSLVENISISLVA